MPVIWIPALLRDLTGGAEQVRTPGGTLRQALDALEARHPGLHARLITGDQLRPDVAVVVDGLVSPLRLRQPLNEDSEVHFISASSGG